MPTTEATSDPHVRSPRRHLWRWIMGLVMLIIAWTVFMLRSDGQPSVSLPGGCEAIYLGSSRGTGPRHDGEDLGRYHHAGLAEGSTFLRWWQNFHASLPYWLATRLPEGSKDSDSFWTSETNAELELRFRFVGNPRHYPIDIFIADEKGWENQVPQHLVSWREIQPAGGAPAPDQHWIRVGGPFPHNTPNLRVRFRSPQAAYPGPDAKKLLANFQELVLPNPFYEGPPARKGDPLPLTKPFRGGSITLKSLSRDVVAGGTYGGARAEVSILLNGAPRGGFEMRRYQILDSYGQLFPGLYLDGFSIPVEGQHWVTTRLAPWSDDPCWRLRLHICRKDGQEEPDDSVKFRFHDLPVPGGNPGPLDRSITRNGITLRLTSDLQQDSDGEAIVTISGWAELVRSRRLLILQDVRDDQGRKLLSLISGPTAPFFMRHFSDRSDGVDYALRLPPDAKSWEVTFIPETITVVEFATQPPPAPASPAR